MRPLTKRAILISVLSGTVFVAAVAAWYFWQVRDPNSDTYYVIKWPFGWGD